MTDEERIHYWMTSQPDCTREEALAILAQEDAEAELDRLGSLLYELEDEQLLRTIEHGARELTERVRGMKAAASTK